MIVLVVLLWLAAGYRLWVTCTRPRTLWRTAFTVAMVSTALAFTLYRVEQSLDALTGVWNGTNLLTRLVLVPGLGFVFIYLEGLRREAVPRWVMPAQLGLAAAVMVILASSWIAAPIHDAEHPDLVALADSPAVTVYCVTFWVYLAVGLTQVALVCLARGRAFRRGDAARSVALPLIGAASVLAVPVMLLWTASVVFAGQGIDAGWTGDVADALLPVPLVLLAAGVLAMLVVPWMVGVLRCSCHLLRLMPLWRAVIRRYPSVHLAAALSGGPLSRLRTAEARAVVEIHDALRTASVPGGRQYSLEALAVAFTGPRVEGGTCAADLLEPVPTREADLQQLLMLADAYKAGSAKRVRS